MTEGIKKQAIEYYTVIDPTERASCKVRSFDTRLMIRDSECLKDLVTRVRALTD
jgi:hypothetical protein